MACDNDHAGPDPDPGVPAPKEPGMTSPADTPAQEPELHSVLEAAPPDLGRTPVSLQAIRSERVRCLRERVYLSAREGLLRFLDVLLRVRFHDAEEGFLLYKA